LWDQEEEFRENYYGLFRMVEQIHERHPDSLFSGMSLHMDNWDEVGYGYQSMREFDWLVWRGWGFSPRELHLNLVSPDPETDDFEWSFYIYMCQDRSDHIRFVKPVQRVPKLPGTWTKEEEDRWFQHGHPPYEWRQETVRYHSEDLGLAGPYQGH
jgi:hypothetical protein